MSPAKLFFHDGLGVGYATTRSHLKAALAKAGLRRQNQLIARVLAAAALGPG